MVVTLNTGLTGTGSIYVQWINFHYLCHGPMLTPEPPTVGKMCQLWETQLYSMGTVVFMVAVLSWKCGGHGGGVCVGGEFPSMIQCSFIYAPDQTYTVADFSNNTYNFKKII